MRSFVRCPNCRQKLLLAANEEGRRKKCPRCSTRFAVGGALHVVAGLSEYQSFELFDQDGGDDIEVMDDDDRIEVLDNPPTAVVPAPTAVPPRIPVAPPPPPEPVLPRRRRRTYAEEYFNPEADDYHFDPRDRYRWNMVQWGVTLVVLPLVLSMVALVILFFSLFVGLGSELSLGAILIAGIIALGCDVFRLAGYALCMSTPGTAGNRLWVIIALILALSSGVVLVIPITIAGALGAPAVIVGFYGTGMTVAMC